MRPHLLCEYCSHTEAGWFAGLPSPVSHSHRQCPEQGGSLCLIMQPFLSGGWLRNINIIMADRTKILSQSQVYMLTVTYNYRHGALIWLLSLRYLVRLMCVAETDASQLYQPKAFGLLSPLTEAQLCCSCVHN